ncbi:MAG: AbgT family transporter [Pseudomonadales bacterium]|nr:AbgT family transporter [Pseudomonadales bacterium]
MSLTQLAYRALDTIERLGNRLPHPALLFMGLGATVIVLSWVMSSLHVAAVHPINEQTYTVVSLMNGAGLRRILSEAVSNFTHFAPVGVVLVIMMGIGVAEHSGLIACVLRSIVKRTSQPLLAYVTAFAGVMSSIGADVGYVVLIPIAALLYQAFDRPALAGIAVAFAGVSAGFSANLLIGPVDVMLASISTEAAHLIDASAEVTATDNYYFIIISTALITLVAGWMSNHVVEPRLTQHKDRQQKQPNQDLNAVTNPDTLTQQLANQNNSLVWVGWFSAIYFAGIILLSWPGLGALAATAESRSPLLSNLVPLLALYFALAGYVFGRSNGIYSSASQAIDSMEKSIATMAYYIVLMFFAAQFVNYFAWTNIGTVTAIAGAQWLGSLQLGPIVLLLAIIALSASINLLVGSASAKWALLAPVFVPMLMLLNIPPEQTQMAYRIGDSTTNIITPLMPYFGIVLAYAQRYQAQLGLGNIIAMMLPYSLALLATWSLLIAIWIATGLPLGP